ncbi:MAG: peptidoglycan DD-metalloendopeptidase family protein [Pararhodobacter sp.]
MVSVLALTACGGGMPTDWDLRRNGGFSTADAARGASPRRPEPDARGVISYPGYQVVIAQRGETPQSIAQRLGLDGNALARQNALDPTIILNGGETLVLPGGTGAGAVAPAAAASGSTITETRLDAEPAPGSEPLRHTVQRGETAFSIARLYNVTARSLADWNGLPSDLSVREGQVLLIPVPQSITEAADARTAAAGAAAPAATDAARPAPEPTATRPGTGSPTPAPPSAATALPEGEPERTAATARPAETPPAARDDAPAAAAAAPAEPPVADMAAQRTSGPRLAMPVEGRIVRAYQRGRNDGVGIGAPAGTAVRAAAAGTVAAITRDTDQVPIMVIRHENNLLTVYANIDDIRVERGARVTQGQTIATVRRGDPSFLHFEVREGFESVDPMPYLQ